MLAIITIISILGITVLVWLANRMLPFQICPICAGVFGTWAGLLTAHLLGYPIDLVVPALLMGGSVVGIAYQLEKKLPVESASWRAPLVWKTIFIPAGFVAAYSILIQWWGTFFVVYIFLLLVSFVFLSPRKQNAVHTGAVEELKKKMQDCC